MRDVIYGRPMNRFWIDFHQLKIDCTVIAVNPSCGCDAEVNACRVLLVQSLQSIHLSSQVLNLLLQFRHLFEKFSRKKNRIFNIRHQTFAELCSNTCYRFWFNQTICTKKLDNFINNDKYWQLMKWSSFLCSKVTIKDDWWNRHLALALAVVVVGIVVSQSFASTYRCWRIFSRRRKRCQPPISKNLKRG